MRLRIVALTCFAVLSAGLCYAQDKSTGSSPVLAWKFKEGLTLRADVTQKMSQSMDLNGQKSNVEQSTEMKMDWKILSVDSDGNANIESVLKRAVMTMKSPQTGDIVVDTDKAEDTGEIGKQLGGLLRPMINAKCTQKMAPTGEISEVKIPEDVLAAMRGNPLLPPGTESMMTDLIAKASPAFPADAIKVGDTWVQEASTPNPVGEMKIKSTYTYRGPEKNASGKTLHKVDVEMDMDFSSAAVPLKITDQSTEGSLYFDNELGRLDNSTVKQSFTMEMEQGPVKIKQVVTQDTQMKFSAQ